MQVPPVVRRCVQLTFRGVRGAARIRPGLAAPCLPILFSACRAEGQTIRSEWGPIMQRKSCTLRSSQHHGSVSAVSRSSRIPHFVRRLPESASPINVAETANASLDMTAAAVDAAPFPAERQSCGCRLPLLLFCLFLSASAQGVFAAERLAMPEAVEAEAKVVRSERDGFWEKSLVVTFPGKRRVLSTGDGFVDARAIINHSADPLLWARVGKEFMNADGCGGKVYLEHVRASLANALGVGRGEMATMATAADMDNLAVVTREFGPLTVTVLATAGAKTNAIRTGVDEGTYIEGEAPPGTINIMVLTNARLTDAAMARVIVTVTEGKTAALQDLQVPSTYSPSMQATGTGTDSVIVVSGTTGPQASYTGGHSRIGELIGKATYAAVVESLGKQNGYFLPGTAVSSGDS